MNFFTGKPPGKETQDLQVPTLRCAASLGSPDTRSAHWKKYAHVRMQVWRTHLERLRPALTGGLTCANKHRSLFGQAPIGTAGARRRFRSTRLPHGAFEGKPCGPGVPPPMVGAVFARGA